VKPSEESPCTQHIPRIADAASSGKKVFTERRILPELRAEVEAWAPVFPALNERPGVTDHCYNRWP